MFSISLCQTASISMPFSAEVYSSVAQFPFNKWQNFVPENNLMHEFKYLKLLEENQAGRMEFRYVFVKQNKETIGVCYFQIVNFKGAKLSTYHAENAIANTLKSLALPLLNVNLMVGGNLLMTGEKGMFFRRDLNEDLIIEAYLQIVKSILNSNSDLGAFLMTDLYESDSVFKVNFLKNGFHQIFEEPDMIMHLKPEWNTFKDYLVSLSSKYRVRAKKCISLSKTLVRKNLSFQEVLSLENEIQVLYYNTISKSNFNLIELQKGFFAEQKKIYSNRYMIFGYFLNEKLIGFNSLYCNNNKGEVHYIGLDYEINKEHATYQRMLYDMIDCGIERKFEQLHFGRTAPEIKSTVGAVPLAVSGMLKHKNGIVNSLIIKPLAAAVKPKNFVFRNPYHQLESNN